MREEIQRVSARNGPNAPIINQTQATLINIVFFLVFALAPTKVPLSAPWVPLGAVIFNLIRLQVLILDLGETFCRIRSLTTTKKLSIEKGFFFTCARRDAARVPELAAAGGKPG